MKIAYFFPSRSRPEKFFAALDNIISMAQHTDYTIYAALDSDDHTMNTPLIEERITPYTNLVVYWGRSTSKVNAINRCVPPGASWDIGVLHSDDMEIIRLGFDLQIIQDMKDGCVVHYTDGHAHGSIISWPVFGRVWYDKFGYIYHPAYQSLFCDEEMYLVAKKMGRLIESQAKIIVHNHPAWDARFTADAQLIKTQKLHPIDKIIFQRRKAAGFYVK